MKKKIAQWVLYDFGNSFVMIVFLFYFSQWLVIDNGKPAWWYNAALIIASALFILSAPSASRKIDATGEKISGLRFWTVLSFAGFALVALLTLFGENVELLATAAYTFAMYAYLMCFLYFTPMLVDLSTQENRSWISGLGQGINSLGQVMGLLVALPFAGGIALFGDPGRAQTFLPSIVLFIVFSIPLLFFYKEEASQPAQKESGSLNLRALITTVFSCKPLAFLLLAYFLFSDAMLTFANNFPLYLETVHGVSDTVKSALSAAILVLAAIGAMVFGKIADKKGRVKTLTWVLVVWCAVFLAMAFVTSFNVLVPIFFFAGIIYGPVWGISRALVGEIAPKAALASSYSFYVVAERFATFIGPAVWSVALVVGGEGARGYQFALLSLFVLLIISIFALRKVKDRGQRVQAIA